MTERWRRIGLIVNPAAGAGASLSLRAARQVIENLSAQSVLTGPGALGADALSEWRGAKQISEAIVSQGRNQTRDLARWIILQKVDALVVVGGDGTLADVAQVLVSSGSRLPIVGVGCGSTNVGRLITCYASRASELDLSALDTWSADCLLASVNDEEVGLALNDVVISNTVVGTVDGRRRDLDAAERMQAKLVPAKPRPVGSSRTRVTRIESGTQTLIAEGMTVAAIIVGFAEPQFLGKAVSGGVCLAAMAGLPAGCIVSDTPLVTVEMSAHALQKSLPIRSRFVALGEQTLIVVDGVDGAVLCTDGNPLHQLKAADRVSVSVRCGAVIGVRSWKDLRSA